MENQPLVSVITVTRNRGSLLGRCISSVLGQTYPNIEHIVVDGASTDNTRDIISTFKDPRLHFIGLEENLDVLKTIDLAFNHSRGEYICFLDSDDEYVPTKIEKQLKLMESLPEDYGMVYCWMTVFDSSRNNKVIRVHNSELRGSVLHENIEKPRISGTPTYFFRRAIFQRLGGWNKKLPIVSDWELAIRCCKETKVDYVPESLVNVYENHGSQRQTDSILRSKNFYQKRIAFHQFILEEYKDIFKKYPRKKAAHYIRMTICAYKDRDYKHVVTFLFKYTLSKLGL